MTNVQGYSGNTWAGWFDGKVNVQGSLTVNGFPVMLSDQMFKENVNDITDASSILNELRPRTYTYDTTHFEDFNFESGMQMGLIAQEVEEIIPFIVSEQMRPAQYDSLGNEFLPEIKFKGIQYDQLISLLVAGHKEQSQMIDSLESIVKKQERELNSLSDRFSALENCLSGILPTLCEMNQQEINLNNEEKQELLRSIINVELGNEVAIVLNQNVPNPFAESTVITFSIPETISKAQIIFHDAMGALIKSVDIRERGNGQINVYANDLSAGTYTYSLIVDGRIVATKRMMKK